MVSPPSASTTAGSGTPDWRPAAARRWRSGGLDIDAALRTALRELGPAPLFLLGHSCGGQLFGLAAASERLAGAIFVAAQVGDWRRWPWPWNLGLLAFWHGIVPLLSLAGRSFPARRFGFSSVDVPNGVMAEWARWARQPEYLFAPRFGLDTSRYSRFRFPLLAYAFDDDRYAPWPAVRALLERLPATEQEVRRVSPDALGVGPIGHFGFFKEPLWSDTLGWLQRAVGRRG